MSVPAFSRKTGRVLGLALYRQVADHLRERIAAGEFQPGAEIPSEGAIADEYEVGRDAVRDAMQQLRTEGVIESFRGFRSRVAVQREREKVHLRPGQTLTARMPNPAEVATLDIRPGVPILVVNGGQEEETVFPADRVEFVNP